jgi:hypothetical protein
VADFTTAIDCCILEKTAERPTLKSMPLILKSQRAVSCFANKDVVERIIKKQKYFMGSTNIEINKQKKTPASWRFKIFVIEVYFNK